MPGGMPLEFKKWPQNWTQKLHIALSAVWKMNGPKSILFLWAVHTGPSTLDISLDSLSNKNCISGIFHFEIDKSLKRYVLYKRKHYVVDWSFRDLKIRPSRVPKFEKFRKFTFNSVLELIQSFNPPLHESLCVQSYRI